MFFYVVTDFHYYIKLLFQVVLTPTPEACCKWCLKAESLGQKTARAFQWIFQGRKTDFEGGMWSPSTLILRNNRQSAKKIAIQKIVFVEPWGFLHRIGIQKLTQEQTTESITNATLMYPWKVSLCLYLIKTKQNFRSSFQLYHLQDFILLKAPAV